jgi:small subunit ribosomal protein S1
VHLSDLSWDVPGEEAVRNFKKGDTLETTVLAIDPERERISLGVKQLDKDPLSLFLGDHPKGSVVTGVVQEVDAKMASIALEGGIVGQLRASEIARDRVEDARTALKVGDSVEARITGVDRKTRIISLSIKAKEAHEEQQAIQNYRSESGRVTSGTTLGDLLKEQMNPE